MTKIRGEEWQLKAPLVSYLIVRLGLQTDGRESQCR